jgi:hypothetical protein
VFSWCFLAGCLDDLVRWRGNASCGAGFFLLGKYFKIDYAEFMQMIARRYQTKLAMHRMMRKRGILRLL